MSARPPAAGLCAACRHGRPLVTRRGSRFLLCERSRGDPTFARYPALPVLTCRGFVPRPPGAAPPGPARSPDPRASGAP